MKFQVSMENGLFQRLNDYSKCNGITRSRAIAFACNRMLLEDDLRRSICSLADTSRKIADGEQLQDEFISKFQVFEKFARLYAAETSFLSNSDISG